MSDHSEAVRAPLVLTPPAPPKRPSVRDMILGLYRTTRLGTAPDGVATYRETTGPTLWFTLSEMQAALWRQCGRMAAETAISARLREMRRDGWAVHHRQRAGAGCGCIEYNVTRRAVVSP